MIWKKGIEEEDTEDPIYGPKISMLNEPLPPAPVFTYLQPYSTAV